MPARPVVAVIPFGSARREDGAAARSLSRRLIDRLVAETALELRPVLVVVAPERPGDPSYLVLGSAPDPALASRFAAKLGATHALTAELDGDALAATLLEVAGAHALASTRLVAPLPALERELARWLAGALGLTLADAPPPTSDDGAYRAFLEALDAEVDAALFGAEPERAAEARARALQAFAHALTLDPAFGEAETALLTLAAGSVEHTEERAAIDALEGVVAAAPRSWRAQYLLGELRRGTGDAAGAIVALEHAHALHPLRDADRVALAELYARSGAPGQAQAHLRAIRAASDAHPAAERVRALVALQRGETAAAVDAFERAYAAGERSADVLTALAIARLDRARSLIAAGEGEAALALLDGILAAVPGGELACQARRLRFGLAHPGLERSLEAAGQVAVGGSDGALAQADLDLVRILVAEPLLWEAEFGRGLIARRRGDAGAAEAAFRRVLAVWPEQPDALHELGVALLMDERTNEASRALDSAAELRPDDPGYVADAGFAHLRRGDLTSARDLLERARSLDAADPITAAYLTELERVEAEVGRSR